MNFLQSQDTSDIQYVVNNDELNQYIIQIPVDNYSLNILLYDLEQSKNNFINFNEYYKNLIIIKNMLQKKNNSLLNTYKIMEKALQKNEFILKNLKNIIEMMLTIENSNYNKNLFSKINFIQPNNNNNINTINTNNYTNNLNGIINNNNQLINNINDINNNNYNCDISNNNNKITSTQVIPRRRSDRISQQQYQSIYGGVAANENSNLADIMRIAYLGNY